MVIDKELDNTRSPNIEYPFVFQLLKNYEDLKAQSVNGTEEILNKSSWRDDRKLLYRLTQVFRFFEEKAFSAS